MALNRFPPVMCTICIRIHEVGGTSQFLYAVGTHMQIQRKQTRLVFDALIGDVYP